MSEYAVELAGEWVDRFAARLAYSTARQQASLLLAHPIARLLTHSLTDLFATVLLLLLYQPCCSSRTCSTVVTANTLPAMRPAE